MKRCNMLNTAAIVMLMCSPAAVAIELSISHVNPSSCVIQYNNVTVQLAKIIPYPPNTTNINSLNNLIVTVMDGYVTPTSQVIVVDHNTGFDAANWLADGLHPNAAGAAWMSDRWYAALTPVLSLP